MGSTKAGESTSDVVIAVRDNTSKRIGLLVAKELSCHGQDLAGKGLALITGKAPEITTSHDLLMIENCSDVTGSLQDFHKMFKQDAWRLNVDHLKMSLLLVRTQQRWTSFWEMNDTHTAEERREAKRLLSCCLSEISRRVSTGVAAFAFTLMGASFGMGVGRRQSMKGTLSVIGLSVLYLTCFFLGKRMEYQFIGATALYVMPLLLILSLSCWNLSRVTRGIE
jgi:lipopolysaccharide export system permease protein